jgi:hypothetical protein
MVNGATRWSGHGRATTRATDTTDLKMRFQFKTDFDYRKLTWSRPDSSIAPFCSVCCKHIPDDDVPLMIWDDKGSCVQFCDECTGQCLEVADG